MPPVILARVDLSERQNGSSRRHPWELARARFFLGLLADRGLLVTGHDWLDVGAGDSWFAERLRVRVPEAATITCWDPNYTAEDLAADHVGITLTAERPERPERRADRILMLDVVEHVEEDRGFVGGIVTDLLAADGWVLASVPAYQSLFSSHDRALQHYRRYSPGELRSLLARSGLTVVANGGLFGSLIPIRVVQVALERVGLNRTPTTGVGAWNAGTVPTKALTWALEADGTLSQALDRRGRALPGLSCWALGRLAG